MQTAWLGKTYHFETGALRKKKKKKILPSIIFSYLFAYQTAEPITPNFVHMILPIIFCYSSILPNDLQTTMHIWPYIGVPHQGVFRNTFLLVTINGIFYRLRKMADPLPSTWLLTHKLVSCWTSLHCTPTLTIFAEYIPNWEQIK